MEHTILSAQDRIVALEYQLFCEIRDPAAAQAAQIQEIAGAVAQVDVLAALSLIHISTRWFLGLLVLIRLRGYC